MLSRTFDTILTGALILILGLAPLPLGSNVPAAWSALTLAVLAVLALAGLTLLLDDRRVSLPPAVLLSIFLFLTVCGWIWAQTMAGLPPAWDHPAWELRLPDVNVVPTPSLDPMLGREALARLVGYAAMLALAFLLGQRRGRAEFMLKAILAIITAYAAFGLLREIMGWRTLFGVELSRGRASGSFVGPNIFAAYVNLGAVIAFCLLLWNRGQEADSPRLLTTVTRLLASLLDRQAFVVVALGTNLLASIASASRAGIMSLGVTALLILALALRGARWPLLVLVSALAAFLAWGMLSSGGETLLDRLSALFLGGEFDPGGDMRIQGWRLALGQIVERPWLGQGYGTFLDAFHLARDERFLPVVFDYLHNTWLELLVELGWPATAALLLSLSLLLWTCIRALRHSTGSCLPLVGLAASMVLGLHGLADFAGQIPAVALTWGAILGLATGRASVAGAYQLKV